MIISAANRLFTPGGCLTVNTIKGYLNGTLRMNLRMQVEDHLKTCRFCSEALDGFRSRGKNTYMMSDVEYLSRKVRRRYHSSPFASDSRFPLLVIFTLTVFLLLLWAIFYVLHQNILMQKAAEKHKADSVKMMSAPVPDTLRSE
jgi:hypothetical protein